MDNHLPEPDAFPGQCTAQSKQSGRRCRRRATPGKTVCRFHGGKSLEGIAHPRYKGKGYSKVLPAGLKRKYAEALADPELLSARTEVALLQVRISELAKRLHSGESGTLWAQFKEGFAEFKAAMSAGDKDRIGATLTRLGGLISRGADDEAAWHELAAAIEDKTRIAAREWRRLADLKQLITVERAMVLLTTFAESVRFHVQDTRTLTLIQRDLTKLLVYQPVTEILEPAGRNGEEDHVREVAEEPDAGPAPVA